jgi:superfamily II DNA/RNA helicase
MRFDELGLDKGLIEGLGHMNFVECTPVQEQAIPQILAGKDIIACAQTGTGKTAAFILPTLHMIKHTKGKGIRALIICPTRELALQIDNQIMGFAYFVDLHSAPVYGGGDGDDWEQQKQALKEGAELIVATPGKLISHIHQGYIDFSNLTHLILDEADRMMDMGFRDDIELIVSKLPKNRQNLMFSATMDPKIRKLIKTIMHEPVEINLALAKPAANVLQAAYLAYERDKNNLLVELIKGKDSLTRIIVFSSTKAKLNDIIRSLKAGGVKAGGISSDFDQQEREQVLRDFLAGEIQVLVGTDVISRGIDIDDIDLVINFDVPPKAEDYVHRVGRTARAKKSGVALTFVSENEMSQFADIEKLIETEIRKLPLPDKLGRSPEWNPNARKGGFRNKGKGRKKPFSRKKGNTKA